MYHGLMNIGELGRLTGVSTKAIRYYEEIGVLNEPERSANGYRTYESETVDRLRFVKDAQLTGLSLAEITTILDQRGKGESTCEHVMSLLDHHLHELDTRIKALKKTRTRLVTIADRARKLDPSECLDPNRCQTIVPQTTMDGSASPAKVHEAPREHAHAH
jgi:DNA-binding transcriptional MerR regulator